MPLSARNLADAGAGREPQAAGTRLAHSAGADPEGAFTSGLSASEYALLGEAGFEPLGFVVGSTIYHVGLRVARRPQNQELHVMSQVMHDARRLALARMRAKADHLGADGIVGVQLGTGTYAWSQRMLEFVATGTAMKAAAATDARRALGGEAFTSDLPAQDFCRLLARGAVPVAFVLGTCVYHVARQTAVQVLRQAGPNQEMVPLTQCISEARELALSRMRADPAGMRATGIVGVGVAMSSHAWGKHAIEFLATGTAIRPRCDVPRVVLGIAVLVWAAICPRW